MVRVEDAVEIIFLYLSDRYWHDQRLPVIPAGQAAGCRSGSGSWGSWQ